MAEWQARRFWSRVSVEQDAAGWTVLLDDRRLRTPGKQPLALPTQALALAIAEEWQAQPEVISPQLMPLTRAANSAIEKVTPQFDEVAAMLAAYGGTDLLCYRAETPESLVAAQAAGWDPLIDWAATELRAPLRITHGVIPVDQQAETLRQLHQHVAGLDIFGLTALHDLVTLPGSLVLGLAVIRGRIDAGEAHRLSRIDEDFQAERWGRDDEAEEAAADRRVAMQTAERLWRLSRI
ncbi:MULTISPECIES: ATP12 family chaperone protein [unclassified Paracoccus (in: a-proteobacteria)]|uniref:ATP12 family chaperone protein n=1 Tax=unclassified Paracoccus (in: a-proteobacteria) TaxID=2688777 RepID=UPI0012B22AB9|nr:MULTISPECIES: ATP12 family protein [unclassified Paracoccus (in: a-proteobacteria)]UXU76102.1 ATPase [Paracoccus sp. SMMA_5]UXU82014.1 ATPase [Paracoccus sp. SMMA_5_TC]